MLGLDWWKENGLKTRPFPREQWYLYPTVVERGLRFEMPTGERLKRIGVQLGRRLHEADMHWWDKQLEEYQALPPWKDFPGLWEASVAKAGGEPPTTRSGWSPRAACGTPGGGNVGVQMIREVAGNISGHGGVVMNRAPPSAWGWPKATWSRSPRRAARRRATWCCARAYAPTRCCSSASSTTGSRRWPRTSACPA